MIIEEVELENFISHRRTIIRFTPGVTLIVGPNGAGKTSIVDAITYTLFGVHGRGQPQAKDPVIRIGASIAKTKVVFSIGSRRYMAIRLVSRGGPGESKLYLVEDKGPRLLAEGITKVKAEVGRLVGVNPDMLRQLMVARQGEIDAIMRSSEERKKLVNAALQVEAVEKAYERMGQVIEHWRARLNAVTVKLEYAERRLRELRLKMKKLEDAKKRLEKLRSEKDELETVVSELRRRVAELEKARRKFEELNAYRAGLRERIRLLREEVRALEDKVRVLEERRKGLEEYAVYAKHLDFLRELIDLLRERDRLRREVEEARKKLEKLPEVDRREIEELEKLAKEYEKLNARMKELEEGHRLYQQYSMRARELRRQIEELGVEAEKRWKRALTEIASVLGLERIAKRTPEELVSSLNSLMERIDQLIEEKQAELRKIEENLGAVKSRIKDTMDKIAYLSRAHGRCPLCGQPLSIERREQLIKKLKLEKDQLRLEEEKLKKRREEELKELDELQETRRKVEKAINIALATSRYLKDLAARIKKMEEEVRKAEAKAREYWIASEEYNDIVQRVSRIAEAARRYHDIVSTFRERIQLEEKVRILEERLDMVENRLGELRNTLTIDFERIDVDALEKLVKKVESATLELKMISQELERQKSLLEERLSELERLEEEDARLEKEASILEPRVREYEEAKKRLEELEKKLFKVDAEIAAQERLVSELEEDAKKLKELEREVETLKRRRKAFAQMVSILERIRREIGPYGVQRIIRLAARELMEYYLRDILQKFGIEMDDVRLTDDYEVALIVRGGEKRMSMLSGGEKVAVAIAFRIALARLAGPRLGVMILDEPTANLDEERRRELVNIIKYGLRETGLTQLIIISHDRELEEAADTVIEVYRDSTGSSAVKVASEEVQH